METATKALNKNFDVPKHKIMTPNGAEASLGNKTNTLCIQNTIMDMLLCVQDGLHHSKWMDFMDMLLVPNFVNTNSTDPRDWCYESETNVWTNWDSIDDCREISWKRCINKFFCNDNLTSRKWLKMFLVNSCMTELQKEIDKKYNKLNKSQKGGFIYLYYMLSCLFTMT